MSSSEERGIRGFRVLVYKDVKTWQLGGTCTKYRSSTALIDLLNSKTAEDDLFLGVYLGSYPNMKFLRGETEVVAEARRLFENDKVLQMAGRIELMLHHFKNYDKRGAVELAKLANQLIRRGVTFERLRFQYEYGSSWSEEEFEAITENIDVTKMKKQLPPLRLIFLHEEGESRGLNILCRFLDFGWPIEYFKIKLRRKGFKSTGFDWKKLKRVIENSGQQFKVDLEAADDYSLSYENNEVFLVKIEENKDILFREWSKMFTNGRIVENIGSEVEDSIKEQIEHLLQPMINKNSLIKPSVTLKKRILIGRKRGRSEEEVINKKYHLKYMLLGVMCCYIEEKKFDRLVQRVEVLRGRKRRRNSVDTV